MLNLPDEIVKQPQSTGRQKIILHQSGNIVVTATLSSAHRHFYYQNGQVNIGSGVPNTFDLKIEVKFKSFDTDSNKIVNRTRILFRNSITYSNGLINIHNYNPTLLQYHHCYLTEFDEKYNSILEWVKDDFNNQISRLDYRIKRFERQAKEEQSKQNFYNNIIGKI